jgi:hypothetical protein
MEAKGTTVSSTPEFIRQKYGEQGLARFVAALSPQARVVFGSPILATRWYPLEYGVVEPTRAVCNMFFGGDPAGAREIGRFSADRTLTGIYKMFVKLHDPMWTVKKASVVFSAYYRPGTCEVIEDTERSATVRYVDFPESSGLVEQRIAGWDERGLEICGVSRFSVEVTRSISRGDREIEIALSWS